MSRENAFRGSTAVEHASNQLVQMINLGEFRPGRRLPTADELAHLLGVSRPIVLQALRVLKDRGLVSVRRGSGAWVSALSADNRDARRAQVWRDRSEILQMVALREMLEAGIARRIAIVGLSDSARDSARSLLEEMRVTEDPDAYLPLDIAFHGHLTGTLRMPLLEDLLRQARARAAAVVDFLPYPQTRLARATDEHERLLDAVVARDPAAAAEAAGAHINGSAQQIVNLLSGDGTELLRATAATAPSNDADGPAAGDAHDDRVASVEAARHLGAHAHA